MEGVLAMPDRDRRREVTVFTVKRDRFIWSSLVVFVWVLCALFF